MYYYSMDMCNTIPPLKCTFKAKFTAVQRKGFYATNNAQAE